MTRSRLNLAPHTHLAHRYTGTLDTPAVRHSSRGRQAVSDMELLRCKPMNYASFGLELLCCYCLGTATAAAHILALSRDSTCEDTTGESYIQAT